MKNNIPYEDMLYIEEINRTFTIIKENNIDCLYEQIDGEWYYLSGGFKLPIIAEKVNDYFGVNLKSSKEKPLFNREHFEEIYDIKILDCYGSEPITIEVDLSNNKDIQPFSILNLSIKEISNKFYEHIINRGYLINIKDDKFYEYRLIKDNRIILFRKINKEYYNNLEAEALVDIYKFIKKYEKN